jgi:hypothetical protein
MVFIIRSGSPLILNKWIGRVFILQEWLNEKEVDLE